MADLIGVSHFCPSLQLAFLCFAVIVDGVDLSLQTKMPYIITDFRDNEEFYREHYDEIEVCFGVHYEATLSYRKTTKNNNLCTN